MSNYTRALEFFIENGISLNSDQIEALKEEFLGEATKEQIEYLKDKITDKNNIDCWSGDYLNGKFLGKNDPIKYGIQRRIDNDDLIKAKEDIDKVDKSTNNRLYSSSKNEEKDKILNKAADKLFKEKDAYNDNEEYNKLKARGASKDRLRYSGYN